MSTRFPKLGEHVPGSIPSLLDVATLRSKMTKTVQDVNRREGKRDARITDKYEIATLKDLRVAEGIYLRACRWTETSMGVWQSPYGLPGVTLSQDEAVAQQKQVTFAKMLQL